MRKMNAELLAKTQQLILAQPARFNIEDFDSDFAGFAIAAASQAYRTADAFTQGRKLLGLSSKQMQTLCLLHLWPRELQQRFIPEPCTKRELKNNARVAVDRIGHFIQAGC